MANLFRKGTLPPPVTEAWDWQMVGKCRVDDNGQYFIGPDGEGVKARRQREAIAKRFCEVCPVLERCRLHALAAHEPYGVWGGLGQDDRRAIFDPKRRKSAPAT